MCKHSCTRRKTTRLHLSAATPKAFLHFGNYFFSFLFFSLFFPCCRPTVANLAISSDRCPFFFYFFFSFRYFYFFSVFASSRHNLHSRKLLVPRNLRNRKINVQEYTKFKFLGPPPSIFGYRGALRHLEGGTTKIRFVAGSGRVWCI